MATVFKQQEAQHVRLPDGSSLLRMGQVPWTDLPYPGLVGISYKIMNYDKNRAWITMLNTFAPGSRFATHKHLGMVEIFMLEGSFFYENGQVWAGDYMCEVGGITHAPASDEGALMITTFHGPLQILDDAGEVVKTVGIDEMFDLAAANGAVAHLEATRG
jgi:anti-sigma factor ChrR (cupin superfamily)